MIAGGLAFTAMAAVSPQGPSRSSFLRADVEIAPETVLRKTPRLDRYEALLDTRPASDRFAGFAAIGRFDVLMDADHALGATPRRIGQAPPLRAALNASAPLPTRMMASLSVETPLVPVPRLGAQPAVQSLRAEPTPPAADWEFNLSIRRVIAGFAGG